jgi:hypothetical protein
MTDYVDTNAPTLPISSVGYFARKYPQFKTLRSPLTAGVMAYIGAAEYTDNADGDVATGNAVLVDGTYYCEYRSFTAGELAAGAVAQRDAQVMVIQVTTVSGKAFDGCETSQNRMARAVAVGSAGDTTMWRLADDSWVSVTWEELKEALKLAGTEQTNLWNI